MSPEKGYVRLDLNSPVRLPEAAEAVAIARCGAVLAAVRRA